MNKNGMQLSSFNKKYCFPEGLELVKITDENKGSYFFWMILDTEKNKGQLDSIPEEEYDNTILVHRFSHLSIEMWKQELTRAINQIEKENIKIANCETNCTTKVSDDEPILFLK